MNIYLWINIFLLAIITTKFLWMSICLLATTFTSIRLLQSNQTSKQSTISKGYCIFQASKFQNEMFVMLQCVMIFQPSSSVMHKCMSFKPQNFSESPVPLSTTHFAVDFFSFLQQGTSLYNPIHMWMNFSSTSDTRKNLGPQVYHAQCAFAQFEVGSHNLCPSSDH